MSGDGFFVATGSEIDVVTEDIFLNSDHVGFTSESGAIVKDAVITVGFRENWELVVVLTTVSVAVICVVE